MSPSTLAALFWERVAATPHADAQIVRRDGAWVRSTWAEVGEAVGEAARGLLALGCRSGEAVAILARSSPEWVQADFAILSVGGVTVPIYPTYTAEQIAYIVNDARVRTLVVEEGPMLARALEARPGTPGLDRIVVLGGEAGGAGVAWPTLRRLGRAPTAALARELAERRAALRPDDVATIVYTSGTTGTPKGVVQTHANHLAVLRALAELPGVQAGDVHLLFLPLSHSFARMEAWLAVHRGLTTAFAQGVDRIGDDLREVRPDFLFTVPRFLEKAHARMLQTIRAAPPVRRWLARWAIAVGRRVSARTQAGERVPFALRAAHRVARRAVLVRLQAAFGGRLRFVISGGAPLGRELAEFFHAIGIPVLEGYGLTEACPVLTWNRLDRFKLGSVGRPLPNVELRLAPDGEVLARAPNVARGYLNQPAETAAVFGADGWLHTGDIGRIDEDGFLFIVDRKKDLIVTSGGLHIAPQPIEALLRREPLVDEVMLHGDGRPWISALFTLDPAEVRRFTRAAVTERLQAVVDATNERLPSHARIRAFAVVPAAFTEAGGELTPTQKIKRRVIADRYRDVLDGLYRRNAVTAAR